MNSSSSAAIPASMLSTAASTNNVLSSLPAFDALLANFHTQHPGNIYRPKIRSERLGTPNTIHSSVIDLVDLRTEPEDHVDDDGNATEPIWLPHCHVVGMLPFTPFENATLASLATYEEAAAMALALEHLNTHNSSIVDDLMYLDDTCQGMVFTLELLDTHFTPGPAIDDVFEFSARSGKINEGLRPCAFVGAARSAVTLPTSLLTGHRGYVQVSATSTSFQLDEQDQYPLFGRTVPSDLYNVLPMLEYFETNLQITHLAVLTLNEAFGQSFGQSIQLASNSNIRIHRINMDGTSPEGIRKALQNLKGSKYRYVLAAVLTKEVHQELMLQAVDMDLAGNGKHQWFFPDSFELFEDDLFDEDVEKDAKLMRAYQGIGVFQPSAKHSNTITDGNNDRYEAFKAQMSRIKNPTDVAYLNSILPQYEAATKAETEDVEEEDSNDEDGPVVASTLSRFGVVNSGDDREGIPDRNPLNGGGIGGGKTPSSPTLGGFGDRFKETYLRNFPYLHQETFLNPVQHDSAAFMYDATILMGLSACQAIAQKSYGEPFSGREQFDFLKQTSFQGVTGEVLMDPETGSRTFNSTTYELINFVQEELHFENGTVKARFKAVNTDVYRGVWESQEPFTFSDGTTIIPASLPPPDGDGNFILTGVRTIAWMFAFISIFLAIGFAVWTYRNRESRVVKASQPFFLYLICSGVILVASSTIPMSFDTQFAPIGACSRACTAATWLLFMGVSVVFSSLWTKAKRINLIMHNARQFKRVTITIAQTLKPMAALLVANIIILTVMTVINPPQFKINTVSTSNDKFGRPRESYGLCAYQEQGWFFLTLAVLDGGILVLSMLQSWHARRLATEFAESKYIFLALASTTVVVFVGAPVLILARDTPNAVLFLGSSINFVFCLNILLLMFVPKIIFRREKKKAGNRVKISGLRQSIFRRGNAHTPSTPATQGNSDDSSSIIRISGVATSEETDGPGERILTTKSARELAKLVNRLQHKLEAKNRELKLLKNKEADVLPEGRQESPKNISTIHEVSCEEIEPRDDFKESEKIQHQLEDMKGELSRLGKSRNHCGSPVLTVNCDIQDVHQINEDSAPSSSFDEENPAPLPMFGFKSLKKGISGSSTEETERVSAISQLTTPEELSLRKNLSSESFSAFHIPSGIPLSASDASMSASSSLLRKASSELGAQSVNLGKQRESFDDAGSSSQFSTVSLDDLDCGKNSPMIGPSMTF